MCKYAQPSRERVPGQLLGELDNGPTSGVDMYTQSASIKRARTPTHVP